ncbi:hypothetical protein [Pseudomonas guariconensis]|uniref:hypothetical protein n=1 Tax=Pseudomonas guariconensis TaxID=1288410 RepID=UPI00300D4B91
METFSLNVADIRYDGKGISVERSSTISVGTKDAPLTVFVESDTDWAATIPSAAGVVVALLVAWLTIRVQKNQILANLSNFRHQWMTELRGCASEYLQAIVTMASKTANVPGFRSSPEAFEVFRQITVLTVRFEMLLSRDDDSTAVILELDNKMVKAVLSMREGEKAQPILDMVNEFKGLLRVELEEAWIDIQCDVGKRVRK